MLLDSFVFSVWCTIMQYLRLIWINTLFSVNSCPNVLQFYGWGIWVDWNEDDLLYDKFPLLHRLVCIRCTYSSYD